jgi:hypothetical protein
MHGINIKIIIRVHQIRQVKVKGNPLRALRFPGA